MKNLIKSCSCRYCKANKKKKFVFKQGNRKFRKSGKPSKLMADYRKGKEITVRPISIGPIA